MLADWGREFRPFTSYHLLMLGICTVLMAGAWVVGLRLRGTPREDRFRIAWGWAVLLYKVVETIHDAWPGRFNIRDSLPLQICDLAAFAAAGAMITQRRTLRTLLYFWGLGLSPQAALMPTLTAGYVSTDFWFFWVSHTMVIGSSLYDVIVKGFRPTFRDLLHACGWTLVYAAVVTVVNLSLDLNYGFIGNTTTGNPPAIERLGPWPLRAFKVGCAVAAEFVALWGIWVVVRAFARLKKPPRAMTG
jgi:hypothetical integral membrane protein (TIGR02206 family)